MRAPFQVLIIPYRRLGTRLEVAALRRADEDTIWQFVSGGGEDSETVEQAARREAREEAGLPETLEFARLDTMAMVPACWFGAWVEWPADRLVVPEYAFAVDVRDHDVVISEEHRERRWLVFDDAMATLRYDSNKTALWELHERLFPVPRSKRAAFDTRHAGWCACSAQLVRQ